MRVFDEAAIAAVLSCPELVEVLAAAFKAGLRAPPRHHHTVPLPDRPDATLLLMPAWQTAEAKMHSAGTQSPGDYIGIKIIAVVPDNGTRGLAAVQGSYLLLSATTGQALAMIDAPALTNWRTAAASALASRYLSRSDSERLLMVGAGGLAPYLIRAHASVRPIKSVAIWNRTQARARECADRLASDGGFEIELSVADDLEAAVRGADIVSVATLSKDPLVHGEWLQPGVHLDTVGAFRPDMRETDDEVMRRARIFVDTREGALHEAGDIVQPLKAGVISEQTIAGDLYDLTGRQAAGRQTDREITYFKSVGASLEDLATAIAIYEDGDSDTIAGS